MLGDLVADTEAVTDWSYVLPNDEAAIRAEESGGIDVLGVNDYSPTLVRQWDGQSARSMSDGHGRSDHSPWIGCEDVDLLPQRGSHTAMGWPVDASGMTELLLRLRRDHPEVLLMVTENGAAFRRRGDPGVQGARRRAGRLPARHIAAVDAAVAAGADVRGYLRVVVAGQLRVGLRVHEAVRDRARGLRHPSDER